MKYAIMYCSKTGNTRQLAEAIYEAFPEKETRIEAVSEKQISCLLYTSPSPRDS